MDGFPPHLHGAGELVLSPVVFGVLINTFGIGAAFLIGAAALAGAVPVVNGLTRPFRSEGGT